jgi:hypothetical protein
MESVISSDILAFSRVHNAVSKQQDAFISRRSTCTNLIETINDWALAIKDKKSIIAAYIDYSRAFDTVCHKKLLIKLADYGIKRSLLYRLKNF